jgi:hypothetical protein
MATAELFLGGLMGGPADPHWEAKDNLEFLKDKVSED